MCVMLRSPKPGVVSSLFTLYPGLLSGSPTSVVIQMSRSTIKHKTTMIPVFTRNVWFTPDTTEFIQNPGCHRPVRFSRASQITYRCLSHNNDYVWALHTLNFLTKVNAFNSWVWLWNSMRGTRDIPPSAWRDVLSYLTLGQHCPGQFIKYRPAQRIELNEENNPKITQMIYRKATSRTQECLHSTMDLFMDMLSELPML